MKRGYKIVFIISLLTLISPVEVTKFPYTIEAEDCEGAGEPWTSIYETKIKGMFSGKGFIYLRNNPFSFNITVEEDGMYQFNARVAQILDKEGRIQTISINGNDYQYKIPYYDTWTDFDFGIHKLYKGSNKIAFKPINGYAVYDIITVSESTFQESTIIRLKNWEFGSSEKISLSGEDISSGKTSKAFFKAPEDAYVCTAMGGLAGNSDKYFFEQELEKVNKTQFNLEWWFKSQFSLENIVLENNIILLHINGINYRSDIYLDGKQIGKKEDIVGTFVEFTLDITSFLKKESNKHYIAFKVERPDNPWEGDKQRSDKNDLAITFVDWNPEPPDFNMGVWQPVDIEIIPYKISTISSAFVNTTLIDDKNSNLEIVFYIKNWLTKEVTNDVIITIGDFVNITLEKINVKSNKEKQITVSSKDYPELIIDNSELWWPYQMGEPKLHELTIKVINKNRYYIYNKKIGLREVSNDFDEDGVKKVYKINGKRILLKGAGWTPDLFLRQTPENYYEHIDYVRDMELNVIRLEGKSEGEEFYDYCDKLGILIITGWCCCDSWQRWDEWTIEEERIGNKSVISQIRKLSHHPSVIIFILGSDKAPSNGIEPKWREILAQEKWANEILSSAHVEKNAPTGVKMTGPYSWVPPHYFYLDDAKNNIHGGAYGFMTEGGPGENPLRKGSYEKVFNEENMYNYTGESWNYHCGKQTAEFDNLEKFINPLIERYGKIKDFNDFQKKSSASVYEGHRAMFEAYSSNKYNATGVIQWMLNNAWPSNIWHLYDYYLAPTPAYFATKKAGERIHALYNYADSYIYLLNNFYEDFNGDFLLNVYIISVSNGKEIFKKGYNYKSIKGDEVIKKDKIKKDYDEVFIIHFEYSYEYKGEKYFYTNTYWVNKEMDKIDFSKRTFYNVGITKYSDFSSLSDLPQTKLTVEILEKTQGDGQNNKNKYKFKITNIGDSFALLLEIKLYFINEDKNELITPIFWNDNYFSLRSGESYIVTAEYKGKNSNDLLLEIIGWNSELNYIIKN